MENIKDNSKETVELKDEELEKVAGGAPKLSIMYHCNNCYKTFFDEDSCPRCGSTDIRPA